MAEIQKQKIILIAGVVLALIAVFMVNSYISQQRQQAEEQAREAVAKMRSNEVAVLVAKKDIPKGTLITDSSLFETKNFPNQYVQPQAVTSLDRVFGMLVVNPFVKGEQVTLSRLTRPQTSGSLAMATPIGKRAVTINVDSLSTMAGMIRSGDKVDMIVMLSVPLQTPDGKATSQLVSVPLFQDVLVLAIGQQIGMAVAPEAGRYGGGEQRKDDSGSTLVTLALNPQEVNIVTFIQEQGKIRLVLRSPADPQIQQNPPVSWDTLFQYIMPQQPAPVQKAEEPQPTIEIYRGLNKDKLTVTK